MICRLSILLLAASALSACTLGPRFTTRTPIAAFQVAPAPQPAPPPAAAGLSMVAYTPAPAQAAPAVTGPTAIEATALPAPSSASPAPAAPVALRPEAQKAPEAAAAPAPKATEPAPVQPAAPAPIPAPVATPETPRATDVAPAAPAASIQLDPPPPAAFDPPPPTEPLLRWTINAGETYEAAVRRWANVAGWTVVYDTPMIWTAEVSDTVETTFDKAVVRLAKGFPDAERQPQPNFFENNTLVIKDR